MVAERPHRVANDLVERCTGVALSSRGAQGLIDSTAQDLQPWQAERGMPAAAAVVDALAAGDGAADLRVEIAMDGVMAHSDGRWQAVQVATLLVRRLDAQAEEPTLGTVIARRSVCVLGAAADLAARIKQAIGEAGWEPIASGEILGDGAPWIWTRGGYPRSGGASDPGLRSSQRASLCLRPSPVSP